GGTALNWWLWGSGARGLRLRREVYGGGCSVHTCARTNSELEARQRDDPFGYRGLGRGGYRARGACLSPVSVPVSVTHPRGSPSISRRHRVRDSESALWARGFIAPTNTA